jgi:hypothetical protein
VESRQLRKRFGAALALGLLVITSLFFASPAIALTDEDQIRSELAQYQVSAADQDTLLDKAHLGILWDSMNPSKLPISTVETQDGTFIKIVSRYADASIKITTIEKPRNPMLRSSVSNCINASGTGFRSYSNCLISNDTVLVHMGFTASFTLVNGGYDLINSASNPAAICRLGTCTDVTLTVSPQRESLASGAANAHMQLTYILYPGIGSSTYTLDLNVGHDTYTVVG